MSGERIVLAGDVDGAAARLVQALARLADVDLGPHALIGGLAVMCRLAAVHRVTRDVDTVTETTVPTAIEMIVSSIGELDPLNPNRVLIEGVKLDVIDTESFSYEDLGDVDQQGQLFVVGHRWALDTATDTEVTVGMTAVSIRVATAAALVAMKTCAVRGRRTREPHKRASDLYDLYRLILEHDRAGRIGDSLADAPFGLGKLVADSLRITVTNEPERAARLLFDGGPEMRAVTAEDLCDVLGPLVDRLAG